MSGFDRGAFLAHPKETVLIKRRLLPARKANDKFDQRTLLSNRRGRFEWRTFWPHNKPLGKQGLFCNKSLQQIPGEGRILQQIAHSAGHAWKMAVCAASP